MACDMTIDPILLSVFARAFKSITDEMSISLQQTTRSPILCEAKDFVTGLYDAEGNMLEQTENLPILSFSLAPVCKYIIEYFGDDIHPGDVIFHNDVFSLGNQNNDVAVYKPIFLDGRLVGWSAAKGHQADIGGAVQGGYNPNATEVWQEALRIPPVKVFERGKLRKDVWDLIFANIRLDIVERGHEGRDGRLRGGRAAAARAAGEVRPARPSTAHKEHLFDSTRKMMEAEIRADPERAPTAARPRSTTTARTPGSHLQDPRATSRSATGASPSTTRTPTRRPTASSTAPTPRRASATILTFLQMVNPDIPHNEGMVRADRDRHPRGHDPQRRLPGGHHLRQPPLPAQRRRHHARAGAGDPRPGHRRLEPAALLADHRHRSAQGREVRRHRLHGPQGRLGRRCSGTDGYDHIGMIDASGGVLDQDYEMFEQQTPHRLVKHEYLDRLGRRRPVARRARRRDPIFVIGGDDTQLVTFGDGDVEPAFGLVGGGDGSLN